MDMDDRNDSDDDDDDDDDDDTSLNEYMRVVYPDGVEAESEDELMVGRKRRSDRSDSDRKLIAKLQKRVKYLERKEREAERASSASSDDEELGGIEGISKRLQQLIADARALNAPGTSTLSTPSAMMARHLNSQCGVSFRQMPVAILTVVYMLFGHVTSDCASDAMRTSRTLSDGADRMAKLLEQQLVALIFDRDRPDRIVSANIMLDGSNKKTDVVAKILDVLCANGSIDQFQLRTDDALSKLSVNAADATVASLQAELGTLWFAFLHGATTDGASAAVAEVVNILRQANERAAALDPVIQMEVLVRKSSIDETLVFDYRNFDRSLRAGLCRMHNLQRVLHELLLMLFGDQGLKNNATIAQNMFSVVWRMHKGKEFFEAINFIAAGGEEFYQTLPPVLRSLLKQLAATRWLTRERLASSIIELVDVVATSELEKMVGADYGGVETVEYKKVRAMATVFDPTSTNVSYFILLAIYMANHSAGGAKSDGTVAWVEISGFLCSSHARIAMVAGKEVYSHHKRFAAFLDGKSGLFPSLSGVGHRYLELPEFNRWLLRWVTGLDQDWKTALPDTYEFVLAEGARAERLGLGTASEVESHWSSQMKKGMNGVLVRYQFPPLSFFPLYPSLYLSSTSLTPSYPALPPSFLHYPPL